MSTHHLKNLFAIQHTQTAKSSIDIGNLFQMKEEYIFVFGKKSYFFINIAGFNEKYVTSVEVLDIKRGIWRDFANAEGTNLTRC